jgi:hypothetical protein
MTRDASRGSWPRPRAALLRFPVPCSACVTLLHLPDLWFASLVCVVHPDAVNAQRSMAEGGARSRLPI